jgi:hypothetical protein
MATDKPTPVSIRLDDRLMEKIKEATERTGLSQQDIMRLTLAIGIEDLKRLNWDLAGTLSRAANPGKNEASDDDQSAPVVHAEQKMVKYPKKQRALRVVAKVAEEHPVVRESGGKSARS